MTSRITCSSIALPSYLGGIEEVPQTVAEEVEAEDREHREDSGIHDEPPGVVDEVLSVAQDIPPAGGARRKAGAQEAQRRLRNRAAKSTMRTAIKRFDAAVAAGDKAEAEKTMALSCKLLDKVAGKGIIHKNTAARKKSRLAHAFNKMA